MRRIIIIAVIYLSGCVSSYFIFRADWKMTMPKYTVGNRYMIIGVSSLSWFSAAAATISYVIDWVPENNTEAKW